jgi:hypothetical protein
MDFHKTLSQLHKSKEYAEWKKNHSDFYLAHAFVMMDEPNKGIIQIGYYNDKTDKMATFIVSPDKISVVPDQEVMKAEQRIGMLDAGKIKLTIAEALKTAKNCLDEHYKKEPIMKSFFIIQELEGMPMFNITYLTSGFKAINIKINAIDGKIVKHSAGVIAQFS